MYLEEEEEFLHGHNNKTCSYCCTKDWQFFLQLL